MADKPCVAPEAAKTTPESDASNASNMVFNHFMCLNLGPSDGSNKTTDQKYREYIDIVDKVDVISKSLESFVETLNTVPHDQKRTVLYVNLLMFYELIATQFKMDLKETSRTVDRQFPPYEEKFAKLRQNFVNLISFLNTPQAVSSCGAGGCMAVCPSGNHVVPAGPAGQPNTLPGVPR